MNGAKVVRSAGWMIVAGWLLAASVGCTALPAIAPGASAANPFQPRAKAQLTDAAAAASQEQYEVIYQPYDGQPKSVAKPLHGTMYVQEALTAAGAYRKYGRMDLELQRALPNGGYHRIPLQYSQSSRRVDPEFDYALRPGDRLIVAENPHTFIDETFNSVLKPLGMDRDLKNPALRQATPRKYRMEG